MHFASIRLSLALLFIISVDGFQKLVYLDPKTRMKKLLDEFIKNYQTDFSTLLDKRGLFAFFSVFSVPCCIGTKIQISLN